MWALVGDVEGVCMRTVLRNQSPGFERNAWNLGGDENMAEVQRVETKALHGPVFPGCLRILGNYILALVIALPLTLIKTLG